MKINDFIQQVKNNQVDIVEHTHKVIEECKKINKEYNYFNFISEELALRQANEIKKSVKNNDKNIKNKKLLGVAISVKDSICVKGVESTAGSRILKGYKPLFNATVIEKVIEEGGIVIGKTAQDEFGFGAFSVNTKLNIPKNPFDKTKDIIVIAGRRISGTRAAILSFLQKFDEICKGNSHDSKIFAKVVEGIDKDSDGVIDSVEFLE